MTSDRTGQSDYNIRGPDARGGVGAPLPPASASCSLLQELYKMVPSNALLLLLLVSSALAVQKSLLLDSLGLRDLTLLSRHAQPMVRESEDTTLRTEKEEQDNSHQDESHEEAGEGSVSRRKKTSDPNQWNRGSGGTACIVKGHIFPSQTLFLYNCVTYRCINGRGYPVNTECPDGRGNCFKPGQKTRGGTTGCVLMTCANDGKFYTDPHDTYRCKDANNICRRLEVDRFSVRLSGGVIVHNCHCRYQGNRLMNYCT